MYELHIIRADYEGWWLFDDWREKIIETHTFKEASEMQSFYVKLLKQMQDEYSCHITGKYNMPAFFNCCDFEYCDDCDEDKQIYYSVIMVEDGEVVRDDRKYSANLKI